MAQHARIKRTPPPDGARRRWWQNRLLQLLAAFVLLCGVAAAGLKLYTDYTNSHFQVTFYRVTSSHVSEKLRVLFLSDLHLREYGEHNEELIQTVQELDPDLILLGGDLVTFPNPEYENMLSLCRSLADVAPLYGVLGNHESEMIYGGVDDQLAEKFSEAGVQLLRNETRTIQIGENNVELIGLEGALKDFYKYGASDCVESLSRQYDTFRICINHVPMAFVDYMQDAPFDLVLAGHTHTCVISFIDLYEKVRRNFPQVQGVSRADRLTLGKAFVEIGRQYGLTIRPCAEGDELAPYGADCSGCMTQQIFETALHRRLHLPPGKNSRKECACFMTADIGAYNT